MYAPGKAAFEAGDKPVGDGAARPLTFYLEPGFDVSGRVLDPAGKPAARVDVRAQPARRSGGMLRLLTSGGYTPSRARTDKEGKFSVRGLPVEGKFTLEAGGGDFAPASVELPQGKAGVPVTGIEIRLEKALILRAKLVDADQKPVTKGVSATLTYRDPKTRRVLKDVPRSGKDIGFSPAGELTISRLPSGLAGVTLTIEGYKDVERKDVQIGGGDKPADLGTIVLDRGKKTRRARRGRGGQADRVRPRAGEPLRAGLVPLGRGKDRRRRAPSRWEA